MLHVIGAAPGAHTAIDWPSVWRASEEYQEAKEELRRLRKSAPEPVLETKQVSDKMSQNSEYAIPFSSQYFEVQKRMAQQYWRSPVYIYSKISLTVLSSVQTSPIFTTRFTWHGIDAEAV
ncbi:hypothetical protein B0J12DRAFT_650904 [Macrophomina phaseolina]|uniref:Uncharacterized protein n=1 Tax=Macrophomina phaseolina TaxID=35725 RepID=A0ABQ8GJP8_9PEZI|nr:hypothetical protein B0J12DRAFT_650904 [Macrophomina phaseolina]